MRNIITTALILMICSLFGSKSQAQCKQRFVYQCAIQNSGQVFLREFNTKFSSGKMQKHKIILNKGYFYTLQLCNPSDLKYAADYTSNPTGLDVNSMLSLVDDNNNIVAATSDKNFKFNYFCPKTGVYWIHIMPLSPETTCAVGVLSVTVGK